ncbi:hypothetical protein GCM10025886_02390 [Tetragenococcus halophilus subsp. flandriensis]|uniref:hypothetical protein n=1 Tax=Tetragenococcus halophilus TaxID=51669 RepID=UPI0023EA05B2|nr:hypothetical protein [Tetragenococcus halophilus]GMA07088.1 hypothetical protein GCM10025886_02390 [Tetragenococcus halophilus subsp. flandriensis]
MVNATNEDVLQYILNTEDKTIKRKLTREINHVKEVVRDNEKGFWIDDKYSSDSKAHLTDGIYNDIERQANTRVKEGKINRKNDYYNFLMTNTDEAKRTIIFIIQSGSRDTVKQFMKESDKVRKSEKELAKDIAEEAQRRFPDATPEEIIKLSKNGFSNVGRWKNAYESTRLNDDENHLEVVDDNTSADIKVFLKDDSINILEKLNTELSNKDQQFIKLLLEDKTDEQIAGELNKTLEATQKQKLRLEDKFREKFNIIPRKKQKQKSKSRTAKNFSKRSKYLKKYYKDREVDVVV